MIPPPRRFSAAPTLSCPHKQRSSSSYSSSSLYHAPSIDSSESMITVIPANKGMFEFKWASRGSLNVYDANNSAGAGSPLSPRSPTRGSSGILTPVSGENRLLSGNLSPTGRRDFSNKIYGNSPRLNQGSDYVPSRQLDDTTEEPVIEPDIHSNSCHCHATEDSTRLDSPLVIIDRNSLCYKHTKEILTAVLEKISDCLIILNDFHYDESEFTLNVVLEKF